jgi:hypothetical protein
MTGIQTHIIRKQNLEVHASVHDAFALKRKMELIMTEISPKLNILFDELVSENEWLQIDKLDIQINDISENDLEEELLKKILQSIHEKLEARKYNIRSIEGAVNIPFETVSVSQKTISALIYFLQNGMFPWWFELTSHAAIEEKFLMAFANVPTATADIPTLSDALKNDVSRSRLTEQFSEKLFLIIVQLLSKKVSANLFAEIELVRSILNQIAEEHLIDHEKSLIRVYHRSNTVLLQLLSEANNYSTPSILEIWIKSFIADIQQVTRSTIELKLHQHKILHTYLDANKISRQPGTYKTESKNQSERASDKSVELSNATKKEFKSEMRPEFTENEAERLQEISLADLLENTDGSIVANAGLILVAPFLPELFKNLGISDNSQLTNINQAIAIMHFIVHGNLEYREYDVLLCKVLCGLENNEPIELINQLPDIYTNEVEQMLTTAISYWTALKNTSPDGLREGFLSRNGKLSHRFDEWFLLVEKKTVDVLLLQLPWTIGFIKLPWMNKMLKVEWV